MLCSKREQGMFKLVHCGILGVVFLEQQKKYFVFFVTINNFLCDIVLDRDIQYLLKGFEATKKVIRTFISNYWWCNPEPHLSETSTYQCKFMT